MSTGRQESALRLIGASATRSESSPVTLSRRGLLKAGRGAAAGRYPAQHSVIAFCKTATLE
jgi:hypothetical protein